MTKGKLKVAIVGATGYAGQELIKILLRHPKIKITSLSAKIEKPEPISNVFPILKGQIDLICGELDVKEVSKAADFIFLALPHRVSMEVAPNFLELGKRVVDLSADYRLRIKSEYESWYGVKHTSPQFLTASVYGFPEFYRKEIKKAKLVANPGCYPTGAILGCAPMVKKNLVEANEIIIDAKSGVSGAGRSSTLALHFPEANENFRAYKVNQHQHMPEINQELSKLAKSKIEVTFTPHLVPMNRGILSTIYFILKEPLTTKDVIKIYRTFYKDEVFIRVLDEGKYPGTKDVYDTNYCDIGVRVDGKKAIVITSIDNLWKGASSQAVQNMNIMCGFKETLGLI
ncbi:MAG: N-acetyl-gamma-glutamyl-phosphate reductase [Omnitrophica WOR_2 bacterium SM23_29]|nr:MAG: N-acetyl-gamma-glutamyl-phosphate reductase [Omnitrophica WOR_2 bacterium SM23_29]